MNAKRFLLYCEQNAQFQTKHETIANLFCREPELIDDIENGLLESFGAVEQAFGHRYHAPKVVQSLGYSL